MIKRLAFQLLGLAFFPLVILLTPFNGECQNKASLKGSVERIKVHGVGLEGNLEGDSASR
jgi:S-formylglutathione hydrolase